MSVTEEVCGKASYHCAFLDTEISISEHQSEQKAITTSLVVIANPLLKTSAREKMQKAGLLERFKRK